MPSHPECTQCKLHEYAFTVGMDGKGPLDAKVMVVAMAPAKQEDLAGIPMVGPSGKLLDSMLSDAGFNPAEVRVTNAVRCTSKDNEVFPSHIEACRKWLIEEIHTVKPEVIIAMGDVALKSLCKRSGISGKRGQGIPLHADFNYACEVIPTWHPAFVLRTPPSRATVVSDLTRVRDRTRVGDTIDWKWWDGKLPYGDVLSYDVETSYFQDKGDRVIQAAVASLGGVYVARDPDDIRDLLMQLVEAESNGKTVVGHNIWKADRPWCNKFLGQDVMPMGDDTIVLAYLEDETQPRSLESLCVKYLKVAGWKEGLHADPNSDTFAEYNARDAVYTYRLYHHLLPGIGNRKRIADRIIKPAFLALEQCSKTGIYIDSEAVKIASEHYGPLLDSLRAKVCELSPEGAKITNPNAARQVGAALEAEGHYLPLTAKTGQASTTAAVIAELDKTPLVEALSEYREVAKLVGTYIKPYQKICETDERRVHSVFTVANTTTGRTSSSKLNVQQLPRDPLIRAFFAAKPGYELCEIDYSSIEFRIAAMIAREEGILARYALDPDWDAHTFVACRYFGISEAEGIALKNAKDKDFLHKRNDIAKSANFGLLFGSSAIGLYEYAKKVGARISMSEAHNLRSFWHATFPGFGRYYNETYEEIKAYGYTESLTGRRRHVGDLSSMSKQMKAESLRGTINHKVQSLAADIALIGLGLCHKYNQPLVSFAHDANYFEYPIGESERKFEGLRRLMVDEPIRILKEEFGAEITVPILVEMKIKRSKEQLLVK